MSRPSGDWSGGPPGWAIAICALLAFGLIFLAVYWFEVVKEEPVPRRRRRRPPPDAPAADHIEHAARFVGDRAAHEAWMHPGTLTGKLTFASWMSRWWASGSFMRRKLLVSLAGTIILGAIVVATVILLAIWTS